jgi:hypothetical protein
MLLAIPRRGYNSSVHLGCSHMNTIIQRLPVDDQFETGSLYPARKLLPDILQNSSHHLVITTTLSQRPISSNTSKLSYEPCRALQATIDYLWAVGVFFMSGVEPVHLTVTSCTTTFAQ